MHGVASRNSPPEEKWKETGQTGNTADAVHTHSIKLDNDDSDSDVFYGLCYRKDCCSCCSKLKMSCFRFKKKEHCCFCTLFVMMVTALFMSVILPLIIFQLADDMITNEVVIDSTEAPNFQQWQTNAHGVGARKSKIHYDLYFFDIQNAADILNGARPIVTEIGPFAYNEFYYRFDIKWFDDGDTVQYYLQRYYVFDQERTLQGLTEFTPFTVPNPVVASFQYVLSEVPVEAEEFVDEAINTVLQESLDLIEAEIDLIYYTIDNLRIPPVLKTQLEGVVTSINKTINNLYDDLFQFTAQSDGLDLFLKVLLCGSPYGVSPFLTTTPSPAWWGWLNDPLLLEITEIIKRIENKTGAVIPWTAAVPGASTNWTSPEDVVRRTMPSVLKTGKRNTNQVSQYRLFNNMNHLYACIAPMKSQNLSAYIEGEQFPSCAYFNSSWTNEEAEAAGYTSPFATPFANIIEGEIILGYSSIPSCPLLVVVYACSHPWSGSFPMQAF